MQFRSTALLLFYHISVTVRFPAADFCSGTVIILSLSYFMRQLHDGYSVLPTN